MSKASRLHKNRRHGARPTSAVGLTFAAAFCAHMLVSGAIPVLAQQGGDKWQLRAAGEGATPSEAPRPPSVETISVSKAEGRTRIVLTLSAPVDASAFLLANPDRAVLDLPDVAFMEGAASGNQTLAGRKGQFSVTAYRFGQLEAGKSRVVFDLAGPVKIAAARLETVEGVHRYMIEFEPVQRTDFLAAVQAEAARSAAAMQAMPPVQAAPPADDKPVTAPPVLPPEPGSKPAPTGDTRPVVVLDPGHGGIDAGARGIAQAWEKDVVLAFARALGEKLEASGRYRVVFTRSGDTFVALPERVRIAQRAGAKLFISIHADALNQSSVQGATVYTVADRASDAHAARLAEKENDSDKLAGVEAGEETGEVSDILFDLTRKETRTFSHFFARSLVAYWQGAGKLNKNPLRSAGFRVLMAHDVPSVLLELGYMSSRADAAKLMQPEWRAGAAAAVARSVDTFFSPRAEAGQAGPERAEAQNIDR